MLSGCMRFEGSGEGGSGLSELQAHIASVDEPDFNARVELRTIVQGHLPFLRRHPIELRRRCQGLDGIEKELGGFHVALQCLPGELLGKGLDLSGPDRAAILGDSNRLTCRLGKRVQKIAPTKRGRVTRGRPRGLPD